MPVTPRNVYSSHVEKIGYDKVMQELYVWWNTGKTSIYSNVPENLAQQVMNSPSIGAMLKSHIKDKNFPHRYGV